MKYFILLYICLTKYSWKGTIEVTDTLKDSSIFLMKRIKLKIEDQIIWFIFTFLCQGGIYCLLNECWQFYIHQMTVLEGCNTSASLSCSEGGTICREKWNISSVLLDKLFIWCILTHSKPILWVMRRESCLVSSWMLQCLCVSPYAHAQISWLSKKH